MSHFYRDRDERGNPAELILLELCRLRHISASLNPAPEEDLAGRRAYDLLIADVPVDVKADWMSWQTGRICVEAASLRHTSASHFIYALPTPSGLYFHSFLVRDLIGLYNAKATVARQDGSFFERYTYDHKCVGDQRDNDAVLLPRDITENIGEPFWKWAKNVEYQMR
jgi:hypothetical protein